MQVILRKDVEKLGQAGDLKSVKDGYARNHLIPRGLALPATEEAVRWFEKGRQKREKLRETAAQKARDLAAKIGGAALTFSRRAGAEGKIFGSVGKSDIVDSLKALGFEVDKSAVALEAALKTVGDFDVEIRLHPQASAKIKVSVLARS